MSNYRHYFIALWLILMQIIGFAQYDSSLKRSESFSKEISLVTENDVFLKLYSDRYYSNGLFFKYSWLSRNPDKKIIHAIDVGQEIYTSQRSRISSVSEIDRPVCGWLFSKYQQSIFNAKKNLIRWELMVGALGKASLAEQLQNNYHKLLGIRQVNTWNYQIKDELGINSSFTYATNLWFKNSRHFSLKPMLQARLGTTFTNAQIGLIVQAGTFERNDQSALFGARLNRNPATSNTKELFLYTFPQIIFQGYNATVQGGLFRRDKGPVVSIIEPWIYKQHLGVMYAEKRFTLGFTAVFQTREAKTQQKNHYYGSLALGYQFN